MRLVLFVILLERLEPQNIAQDFFNSTTFCFLRNIRTGVRNDTLTGGVNPIPCNFVKYSGKRKKERVKLGLCASLLALSNIDVWVSCIEEVPQQGPLQLNDNKTQSAIPISNRLRLTMLYITIDKLGGWL